MNTAVREVNTYEQLKLFPEIYNEQKEFLQILHHDAIKRNGFFSRLQLSIDDKGNLYKKETWSKVDPFSLMTQNTFCNSYISVHSFDRNKREAGCARTINAIYLDLDFHSGAQWEIDARISNTESLLEECFDDGTLPRPTLITNSGRGLGVFYVLNKSIAAKSKNTEKQVRFWAYLYEELYKKFNEILSGSFIEQLELDHKVVADKSRVTRLPLTVNLKTEDKRLCRLSYVNRDEYGTPVYYSLSELARYVENYNVYEKAYDEVKKEITKNKIINYAAYTKPYLVTRLRKLERAQELLKDQKSGCRELLCFYYYNTAKQIMAPEEAERALYDYHGQFKHALESEGELKNIVKSVNQSKDLAGNIKGYYKISDEKIIRELGLDKLLQTGKITQEQYDYIGFGKGLKETKRAEQKAFNQKKRKERNKRVIEYVVAHPEATYEEIAGLFGVSLRTLKNVLKEANVGRYQKEVTETSICDADKLEEDKIVNIKEHKKERSSSTATKVQNFAPVSYNAVSRNSLDNILLPSGSILFIKSPRPSPD